jgi:hypothetical protein
MKNTFTILTVLTTLNAFGLHRTMASVNPNVSGRIFSFLSKAALAL